jgi:hypothetical protein
MAYEDVIKPVMGDIGEDSMQTRDLSAYIQNYTKNFKSRGKAAAKVNLRISLWHSGKSRVSAFFNVFVYLGPCQE